ncbi:unnamed protein product [Bathycoccus prasinos]
MTKPKHMYVPTEEQTGNQVRTPAQLEALAKGRARYMEKVNARKEAGKKENGEEEEREEKEVDAEVDEPPEPEESPSRRSFVKISLRSFRSLFGAPQHVGSGSGSSDTSIPRTIITCLGWVVSLWVTI